jgi:hypothetical protein
VEVYFENTMDEGTRNDRNEALVQGFQTDLTGAVTADSGLIFWSTGERPTRPLARRRGSLEQASPTLARQAGIR